MIYTPQQLRELYLKLPQDLRDALFDIDSSGTIITIGEKHKLNVDEMGELADETGQVMLGVTHPNNFISNLAERLGVDKQKAKEIAEDINVNVFKKVRESLKKIHNIRDEKEAKTETPPKPKDLAAGATETREEILKEIERNEAPPAQRIEPPVPDILKGSTTPAEEKNEEQKPPPAPPIKAEQKYQLGSDPYREKIG